MTHEEILRKYNTEIDLKLMRHEAEYTKLRAGLVEKYGEAAVARVDLKQHRDWMERIIAGRFMASNMEWEIG